MEPEVDGDDDDLIVIELRAPPSSQPDDPPLSPSSSSSSPVDDNDGISISHTDAPTWDVPRVLSSTLIRIRVVRSRLVEQSSYFRGLLGGFFSESKGGFVSVSWDPEVTLLVLQFISGSPIVITAANFLSIMEGSLFFGVEALLLQCETWLGEATSSKGVSSCISLDNLIKIWKFGMERALNILMQQCETFLARNFMSALSDCSFALVPYNLLRLCLEHPDLTVNSEKHLCEALLLWLAHNSCLPECHFRNFKDDYTNILRKVKIGLLPLCYAAGKRRNLHFSKLADKAIQDIFALIEVSKENTDLEFLQNAIDDIRIRLTRFCERVDLSGCPQISVAILLLSVLPTSSVNDNSIRRALKQTLTDHEVSYLQHTILCESLSNASFEAVTEVDISNCPGLNLDVTIRYLDIMFPSLRILRASHCSQFTKTTLYHLIKKCPSITEVDLSVDISPVISSFLSVLSADVRENSGISYTMIFGKNSIWPNLSKLILEGRTDIEDSDLHFLSVLSGSLSYLNLEGCTMITDFGICELIKKCVNLCSLLVSDTAFGKSSIIALCADFAFVNNSQALHRNPKLPLSLASGLHELHIGGCQSIDESSLIQLISHSYSLKSLNLRATNTVDKILYSFIGTSLENLEVSNTKISINGLLYIIKRNSTLRSLKTRDCRMLNSLSVGTSSCELPLYCSRPNVDLYQELRHGCTWEYLECGWGFHSHSLESLRPSISILRSISIGLGSSLCERTLFSLTEFCPLLEIVILKFQVISSDAVRKLLESLRHLQTLVLCCCLGELSAVTFQIFVPKLKILRLERVAAWMTNHDLAILSQNCVHLCELSLSGCPLLDSDSQKIISSGWPGLTCIHLEDCGGVTSKGVVSLLECKAVQDLLLRHCGCGIQRNFISVAASELPMLRKLSIDLCDAVEGGFDSPGVLSEQC